jgi:predicted acylesterase/phospholipase RssA
VSHGAETTGGDPPGVDLLLSSGFLAFARHAGVLAAIDGHGVRVNAVVGTSSGALVGALWAAGMSAAEITDALAAHPPWRFLRPVWDPWRGLFVLGPLQRWVADRLPATFAELPRPFAAGVVGPDGVPRLLTEGPLPAAVVASCAIPWLFQPIAHGGTLWRDGGVADRLMFAPWEAWRGRRRVLVHLVKRTGGVDSPVPLDGLPVIRTPRSGASFFSLGNVPEAVGVAERLAAEVIREFGLGDARFPSASGRGGQGGIAAEAGRAPG